MPKKEKRATRGWRLPADLMKRLKKRAEDETEVRESYVTQTEIVIRAIKVELAKGVRRG